jgi:Mn-dependent DtxR family transcriptional regulator
MKDADLSTPERLLLFCFASGTEWKRAGVTQSTVTAMIVRHGLIQRDPLGRLSLTKQGRDTLDTLLQRRSSDQ